LPTKAFASQSRLAEIATIKISFILAGQELGKFLSRDLMMEDDIPEGYRPDPPGNIEAMWHKSHTPILDLFPYPNNKSPIIPSTSDLDEDWLLAASSRVRIFMTLSSSPNIREYKDEHIQFFFWTALDRSNRRYKDIHAPNARLWEFHDMHGMLAW
jgi:2-polyprenyl-6-methoxyphenol hydroxylase-like FAD-dependent oxidoreductase